MVRAGILYIPDLSSILSRRTTKMRAKYRMQQEHDVGILYSYPPNIALSWEHDYDLHPFMLKPAYYQAMYNKNGIELMEEHLFMLRNGIRNPYIIYDGKNCDIGNTMGAYASAAFDKYNCDAMTVSPYMGFEALEEAFKYDGKTIFVTVKIDDNDIIPRFDVLTLVLKWRKKYPNIGVYAVKGNDEFASILLEGCSEMPILIDDFFNSKLYMDI